MQTPTNAEWEELVIPLRVIDIGRAVSDERWQRLRVTLSGTSLSFRYKVLRAWLEDEQSGVSLTARRIQVANYVNALKRGGMIKNG